MSHRALLVALVALVPVFAGCAVSVDEPTGTTEGALKNDPCAAVRCAAGTHCVAQGGQASCVSDTCDPSQCTGPMPAGMNYLCPDGTTVAGPACLGAKNKCSWGIVACP